MDWISLAVLAIIWAVVLVPAPRRRGPERNPLAVSRVEMEEFQQPGRWILSPKRSAPFVGRERRVRMRARQRRRRVITLLLETMALTALIGMFPPLRAMLWITGALVVLLLGYVGLMVAYVHSARPAPRHAAVVDPGVVVLPETRDAAAASEERRLARVVGGR